MVFLETLVGEVVYFQETLVEEVEDSQQNLQQFLLCYHERDCNLLI